MLDGFKEPHIARPQAGAPQHFQHRRLRKLRRAAQAAIDAVESVAKLLSGAVEFLEPDDDLAFRPRPVGQPRQQGGAVLLDLLRLVAKHA